MEGAAQTGFALDPHVAAHCFDESGRDRKPQPGASKSPRHRIVGLCEISKDQILFLQWNAYARVAYGKMEGDFFFRRLLFPDPEHDFAVRCELHGIADEVKHNLTKAARISPQSVRHLGNNVVRQFEPLLVGADTYRLHGAIQAIAQV